MVGSETERDADGHSQYRVPNQEVWGFTRDIGVLLQSWTEVMTTILTVVNNGVWSSISLPNGEQWTIRRDGYNRVTRSSQLQVGFALTRCLGQVTAITLVTTPLEVPKSSTQIDGESIDLSAMDGVETDPPQPTELSQTWTVGEMSSVIFNAGRI